MQNNPVINMEATGKNIIRLRQNKGMSVKVVPSRLLLLEYNSIDDNKNDINFNNFEILDN